VEEAVVSFLSPSPAGSEEDVSGKESDDAFEEAGNSSPEEDELGEQWNPDFYTLQLQAPQPQAALCPTEVCFWCTSVAVYFRSCFSFNSVIFSFRSKASQLTMDESELLIISQTLH
jgi:hypothetical protein